MGARVALLALPLALALALPAAADASSRQFSIIQDDATFVYGKENRDPAAALAEAKALGADVVRVFLTWHSVSPNQYGSEPPPGFDLSDPDSPHYRWELYDALIERTRALGMKVLITISPPIPWWAPDQPGRCPHAIGGYVQLGQSCMWKPSVRLFAQFVRAVVRRYGSLADGPYGGQVLLWSLYNEPNLEHYLLPQVKRTRFGRVDLAARRYRELWIAGYREIAAYDPASRDKVLFGDTAAISSPTDTLNAALCLDEDGLPFKGALGRLQGCRNARRLPIAGLALHPYNNYALGSVHSRSATPDSLPMAYLGRAHDLLDNAARRGRIPRRAPIYITEFGFQSRPPGASTRGLPLTRQAAAINEAERLFHADPRIRSVAQYELFDPPTTAVFNTGLRLADGTAKPALAAFQMPLVVTRLDADRVEIWGQARPAAGRVRVEVRALGTGARWRPLTNASGYFGFRVRRAHAAGLRYRASWTSPEGEQLLSRVARAGKPIAYRE